jgi:hypothetical protein
MSMYMLLEDQAEKIRKMEDAIDAAMEFIADQYRDPTQEEWGEWLAKDARPTYEILINARYS